MYKKYIEFSKKKFIIGIVLAVLIAIIGMITGCSHKVILFFSGVTIIISPVRLKREIIAKSNYSASLLGGVTCFVTLFLTQFLLNEKFLSLGIMRIIFGMVCIGLIYFTFYAILPRFPFVTILTVSIVLLLSTINSYVLAFRGNELTPADLFSIRTAFNVIKEYNFHIEITIVYSWIIGLVYMFAGFVFYIPLTQRTIGHVKKYLISVVFIPVLGMIIYTGSRYINTCHFGKDGTRINGYILNFVLQIKENFIFRPEEYNIGKINDLEKNYERWNSVSNDAPNIIVVMNESFADFRVFGDNYKMNENITPYFDSMEKNTIKGYALTSVYGGGTANSEYEFLTGNTMAFLPKGSIPYQQYIKREEYSWIKLLKEKGYRCISTHPYFSSGWARTSAYPLLGFERSTFIDSYPKSNMIRNLVSDREMFEYIIKELESKPQENPKFIFGVTMQNHGSYDYSGDDFERKVQLSGYSMEYPDVEQYLSLIKESDTALKYLVESLKKVDSPVVLVYYGDHQPKLNDSFYKELYGGTYDTLDKQVLEYMVPFVIWTNFDIEEKKIECTSLNYLSNYMFEAAGIGMPVYNQVLLDFQKQIPAINSLGYYSLGQRKFIDVKDAVGNEKEILDSYKQLQYNCMFDKKNRNNVLFPIG